MVGCCLGCLKLEGCVLEAMVDGLARFLGVAVWLCRSGNAALLQQPAQTQKISNDFDVRNEGGPGIVLCTQPKVVTTKFKKCVRKLAFNLYIKTFFLVYM